MEGGWGVDIGSDDNDIPSSHPGNSGRGGGGRSIGIDTDVWGEEGRRGARVVGGS